MISVGTLSSFHTAFGKSVAKVLATAECSIHSRGATNEDKTMTAIDKLHDFLYSDVHRRPVNVLILEDSFYDEVMDEAHAMYELMTPNAPKVGTWFYGRRLYKWSEAMGANTHGLMAMAMTAEEFQNRWLYYPHLIIT